MYRAWIVLIGWAGLVGVASAQNLPHDVKNWKLEYAISGGNYPIHRGMTLTSSGDLTVWNFDSRVSGHASSELMTKIGDFLKTAKRARPFTPGPDQRYSTLTLTSPGVSAELEPSGSVTDLLFQTMDATMSKALLGSWWESEWKLCNPAAQITAEQVDPPIERLEFSGDGSFSVTWRGGGAEAPGRPGERFVWVPDYSGRYTISPDHNGIHLSFVNGIRAPRDFEGDGNFVVDDQKLVLMRLWLGTNKAKVKPDICEITFKRLSEPVADAAGTRK